MVRSRPRKRATSHHAALKVNISRVERLLFHRYREALTAQLRVAGMNQGNGIYR